MRLSNLDPFCEVTVTGEPDSLTPSMFDLRSDFAAALPNGAALPDGTAPNGATLPNVVVR